MKLGIQLTKLFPKEKIQFCVQPLNKEVLIKLRSSQHPNRDQNLAVESQKTAVKNDENKTLRNFTPYFVSFFQDDPCSDKLTQ